MQIGRKLPLPIERNLFYIAIFGLIALLYGPVILHWIDGWLNKSIGIEHEYFSHALIGVPFAAYICWQKRKKWVRLKDSSFNPLGVLLLSLSAIFYLTGSVELVNLSFPLLLTGICLWIKGIPGLKLMWFPLILVWLATPNSIPYLITPYTFPLQKFIASVAGFFLMQFGFDVNVDQIYLSVEGRMVEVAPYCAGLKMLFTSLYISLMLLYWTENITSATKTTVLLIGAVVISTTANIIRNAILAFFHGTDQEGMFHWLHDSWGGDLYSALMLGTIVLLLKGIENINWNYGE